MENQAKLFDIIFNEDEISWQSMIHKLVREEGMNPWDINITQLAKKFLERLQKLKKMDFKISGKAILAAAILLRIKSRRLVGEDFNNLDRLISLTDEQEDDIFEEIEESFMEDIEEHEKNERMENKENYRLTPKTPLPRKRKVSVYDLVDALHKALEVKKRRTNRINSEAETNIDAPQKQKDITLVIQEVYDQIKNYIEQRNAKKLMFSQFLPKDCSKEEKIATFSPLLYLDNQRKIELYQEKHLAEIEITLNGSK